MKFISINIGQQKTLDTPNGQVQTGIIKKSVSTKVVVTELGLEGDAVVDTSVHRGLFVQAARIGAYARVIKTGAISAGDDVVLIKTEEDCPSISDVFKTCHSKTPNMEIVQKALASPLGRHHKNIIQGIYDRSIG